MKKLPEFFFAAMIVLATGAAVSAAPHFARTDLSAASIVRVQYGRDLCGNWHRQCAGLYGYGTRRWNACMNQPQARYDCGAGGYRGGYGGYGRGEDLCGNWRRECSRLYGRRTQAYRACMYQPQALADCGRY